MKITKLSKYMVLLLGGTLTLTSCGKQVSHKEHLNEYISVLPYHDNYHVAQIADLHWSNETDIIRAKEYFKGLTAEIQKHYGSLDLFEFTGDQFMLASKLTVYRFMEMMREINIPYAVVFGNHDRECSYSQSWLSNELKKEPLCIYNEVDNDDVFGHSNFVINLNEGETTKWQLFNLDSGASYLKRPFDPKLTYDYLRDDQFALVDDLHQEGVPGVMYCHIAQNDFDYAFEKKDTLYNRFFKFEGFGGSNARANDKALNCMKRNEMKGVFVGHAHSVDWTVDYEGITYGFGVKTGKELYFAKVSKENAMEELGINQAFDLQGSSVITLKNDKTFDLEHLYYNHDDNSEFIHWEKYHA